MTLSPPENPPPASTGSSLEHLHKMSRTAGLGSTDYVAVNTTAVTTLILGLLSGLSLLGTILLVLPVATLVVGILAVIQIRRSAGTQSGYAIAVLGLVLAFGFVGVVGGKAAVQSARDAVEQRQISALIDHFGQSISSKNYDAAFGDFTERAQGKTTKTAFSDLWSRIQASPYYGAVSKMESNGIVVIIPDPETGILNARGVMLITLPGGRIDRRESTFSRAPDGKWLFEEIQGFTGDPTKSGGQ